MSGKFEITPYKLTIQIMFLTEPSLQLKDGTALIENRKLENQNI